MISLLGGKQQTRSQTSLGSPLAREAAFWASTPQAVRYPARRCPCKPFHSGSRWRAMPLPSRPPQTSLSCARGRNVRFKSINASARTQINSWRKHWHILGYMAQHSMMLHSLFSLLCCNRRNKLKTTTTGVQLRDGSRGLESLCCGKLCCVLT